MRPAITLHSRALSALLLALICASAARAEPSDATAEEPQQQMDDESVPLLGDEPPDLSTPVVEPRKATIPLARPGASTGWDAKVGVDYRKPSIPAAEFQPGELTAGAIPDQSTGVAWANVTAPGLDSPLGWDKTAIETPARSGAGAGQARRHLEPVGPARRERRGHPAERLFGHARASGRRGIGSTELGDQSGAAVQRPADRHQLLARRGDLEHGRQVAADV
jgi:hypothetical protein